MTESTRERDGSALSRFCHASVTHRPRDRSVTESCQKRDRIILSGSRAESVTLLTTLTESCQTLDMDMLVKLPVVQNLPLAALILGAPQIGGAVWLVDKLLGEPLSAITTARYDITGSWEKPNVKLSTAMNASKKDRSKQKNLR